MRPVVRGARPVDEKGNDIQFAEYQQARGELIRRMGEYCSYCEMQLDSSLSVEHKRPKKPPGVSTNDLERELDWNNFLLACVNCNSTKDNTEVLLNDYFWPDSDNTFRALRYSEGGLIVPAPELDDNLRLKAQKTIELTGLHKQPLNDPAASDRRWQNRRQAWDIAQRSRQNLEHCNTNTSSMKEQIIEIAAAKGYWSVWMTVFQDDPDMRRRLIDAFPGTCSECFDSDGNPVARLGGQC